MSDGTISKRLVLRAADELRIVCGDASLILKKDGTVSIRAKDFDVNASGDANIKAGRELKLKGAKIAQN
jgi:type VI secretion system secreted protein VgrG